MRRDGLLRRPGPGRPRGHPGSTGLHRGGDRGRRSRRSRRHRRAGRSRRSRRRSRRRRPAREFRSTGIVLGRDVPGGFRVAGTGRGQRRGGRVRRIGRGRIRPGGRIGSSSHLVEQFGDRELLRIVRVRGPAVACTLVATRIGIGVVGAVHPTRAAAAGRAGFAVAAVGDRPFPGSARIRGSCLVLLVHRYLLFPRSHRLGSVVVHVIAHRRPSRGLSNDTDRLFHVTVTRLCRTTSTGRSVYRPGLHAGTGYPPECIMSAPSGTQVSSGSSSQPSGRATLLGEP